MSSSSFSTTCALPWALCCKRERERERERERQRERERGGGGRSSYNCLFSRFSMELDVLLTLKGEESLLRLFLSVKVS